MVIVEVNGGLGNQMFQYALYRKLEHLGKDAYIDKTAYEDRKNARRFLLDIFDVSYRTASKSDIIKKRGFCVTENLWNKIARKLRPIKTSCFEEDLYAGYQPKVFDVEDAYISGFWQMESYFSDIQEEIVKAFTFPKETIFANTKLQQMILESKNPICVHVRRTDYLEPAYSRLYKDICTPDYYNKAIQYIRKHVENPTFYIFTDDPEWVEENMLQDDMILINSLSDGVDYHEMYLMTLCRHHIIANSTFSWWGAWLNRKADKIVVSPSRWMNGHEISNCISDYFVTIEV